MQITTMKISIIIPTYNRKKELTRSIDSVLSQTYKNIELLVVDDASSDFTNEYFLGDGKYANNPKIIYIRMLKNGGVHNARNRGIQSATGEFIAFLDSDDELLPNTLSIVAGVTERDKEIDFILGPFWTDKGEVTGIDLSNSQYLNPSRYVCSITHHHHKTCFVMVRSTIARENEFKVQNLDFMFYRYVARKCRKIYYLSTCLGIYHTEQSDMTKARRAPNINLSICRAKALVRFVRDFENEMNEYCPAKLAPYAYGAAVGLMLDNQHMEAVKMARKAALNGRQSRYVCFLLLTLLPFSPLILRLLFNIKKYIYERNIY